MIKKKAGYTLIEVIIALGILGILAAGFLPVFFSAYLQIINSGHRSNELNNAQDLSESQIMEGATVTSDSISFIFTDSSGNNPVTVQISGEYVQNDPLQMFLPEE